MPSEGAVKGNGMRRGGGFAVGEKRPGLDAGVELAVWDLEAVGNSIIEVQP